MFKVKGVSINAVQNSDVLPEDYAHETVNFNLSCVVAIYALSYSIMKSCSYWNSNTLATIVDNSKRVCDNLCFDGRISPSNLPKTVDVCGAEVSFNVLRGSKEGLLCDSVQSKSTLENAIINIDECTGFLMWLSCFCISCIYKPTKKSKYMYSLLVYNENHKQTIQYTKNINGTALLVEAVHSIQKEYNSTGHYKIQFVSCSCANVDRSERKKIMKNHRQKQDYETMEPSKKKIFLEKKQVRDMKNKNELKMKQIHKYKTMDAAKKQDLLNNKAEQYRTMDTAKKQDLLNNKAEQYRTMDTTKKQKLVEKSKEEYTSRSSSKKTVDSCVQQFRKKIMEGPYYICCVCNRTLYKKSVLKLNTSSYPSQDIFKIQSSYDGKEYICKTCHSKAIQGRLPCQAIVNNLTVDDIPTELGNLKKLEQILIAQRIIFEKVIVMPKGQQRKIKGAICNVPVNCDQTCNILPRPPERSGIILLKLKRKLQFRGHVYFQPVRPEVIMTALNWLTANNPLYQGIQIDCGNIDVQLTDMTHNENHDTTLQTPANNSSNTTVNENRAEPDDLLTSSEVNSSIEASKDNSNEALNEEEVEDPLNEHRSPASETCLQSVIPDYPILTEEQNSTCSNSSGAEIYNIAPGENKHPVSLMNDKLCEELAFPVLFPKGRFGYTAERQIKITPVKYFNARLLHHSGRFASNPEYLFFAQFVIEQKKVSDNINIALKKVHGQNVTASQVRTNTQILQNLISQDQAYLFLRQIPGSPPYWQKFMYEVVAMVKQLGIPTWFMTLSCADLRWPELFQIIARTNGKNITAEEVEALSYDERCRLLNLNPVIVAKHFQYRVETFFTEILLTNMHPIGKIVYYALRIEFQMRGSPHLHALIWTSDCPKLSQDTKQDYIDYVDQHVQAYLPDKDKDLDLYELVKKYQTHSHSKSCRKYKNIACRFNFGQFFTDSTVVAEPLPDDMDEEIKAAALAKRKEILCLVKQKIDEVLNTSKPQYLPTLSKEDIFQDVGITKEQYQWALSISLDSDYEVHLKRPIDSCFTNNYFIAGIKGFAANVDLQPVFNHYKCITYVCSYFTKDETECSQAIMNAAKEAKEAKEANLNIKDGLRKIGAAFLSSREVSSQECVYRCMPELWLRKIFPKTVFVSTDLPEKRLRVAKSQQELDELDDDSTDIYKSNIIERYSIRPNIIPSVNNMCLAAFAAYYNKEYKSDVSETMDAQPEILSDDIITQLHQNLNHSTSLPGKIRLMNGKEVMKCRKVKAVIRYHTPNKTKEPEQYFHHLLMLYYPWRQETELLGNEQTYMSKFYEPEVQAVVEHNKNTFEPDSDAVTEALETLRNRDITTLCSCSYDAINDQENEDLQSQIHDHLSDAE